MEATPIYRRINDRLVSHIRFGNTHFLRDTFVCTHLWSNVFNVIDVLPFVYFGSRVSTLRIHKCFVLKRKGQTFWYVNDVANVQKREADARTSNQCRSITAALRTGCCCLSFVLTAVTGMATTAC